VKILDELDLKIIDILTKDARKPFREIAQKIGVSVDTIIKRCNKLRREKVIRGSTMILDPKKIGYNCMIAFMINAEPTEIFGTETSLPNITEILKRLIRMPNIILATKTINNYDLLAIGVAKNFEQLQEMIDEIAKIPGVLDVQLSFWVKSMEICPKYFII